jgi:hypothetical protein
MRKTEAPFIYREARCLVGWLQAGACRALHGPGMDEQPAEKPAQKKEDSIGRTPTTRSAGLP